MATLSCFLPSNANNYLFFDVQLFIIPVLIGLLFELLVLVPMRVPIDESPVFLLYQDWAIGLIFLKIWTRLVSCLHSYFLTLFIGQCIGCDWYHDNNIQSYYMRCMILYELNTTEKNQLNLLSPCLPVSFACFDLVLTFYFVFRCYCSVQLRRNFYVPIQNQAYI